MKKLSILPNVITAFGLACGLFVIFKVSLASCGTCDYKVVKTSFLFLLLAGFADFIDGAIARVFRAESEFGSIFDSLSDSISFGVAPVIIFLKAIIFEKGSFFSFLAMISGLIFAFCGVLRLARYNCQSQKAKGNIISASAFKKNFTGLPIPAAAFSAVSINLFFLSPFAKFFSFEQNTITIILSVLMIVLGYFMVSRWKFPSLKVLNFKMRSFYLVFLTVLIAFFVLYGALHYFSIVSVFISFGYVFLAIILSIIRIIAGKKSKTLEDFEPEPEDGD